MSDEIGLEELAQTETWDGPTDLNDVASISQEQEMVAASPSQYNETAIHN